MENSIWLRIGIFIIFNSDDRKVVKKFIKKFNKYKNDKFIQVSLYYDEDKLRSTNQGIREGIKNIIKDSNYFFMMHSSNMMEESYVDKELKLIDHLRKSDKIIHVGLVNLVKKKKESPFAYDKFDEDKKLHLYKDKGFIELKEDQEKMDFCATLYNQCINIIFTDYINIYDKVVLHLKQLIEAEQNEEKQKEITDRLKEHEKYYKKSEIYKIRLKENTASGINKIMEGI